MKKLIALSSLLLVNVASASVDECVSRFPEARYKLVSVFSEETQEKTGSLKITQEVLRGEEMARLSFSSKAFLMGLAVGSLKGDKVGLVVKDFVDGKCIFSLSNKNPSFDYGPKEVYSELKNLHLTEIQFFDVQGSADQPEFKLVRR